MAFVVTGITPDGNIAGLESALQAAGLPLDPIQVVSPGDESSPLAPHRVESTGLITGGGLETGTGVPGLTAGPGSALADGAPGTEFFTNDPPWDRLADLEIPDDEIENYMDALEAGRSVIAYFADAGTVAKVSDIFAGCGLAKVKVF